MLNWRGRSKHYDQGIRLFDDGRYQEAICAFQAALAEPKGAALTARLARFYLAESYSALARGQMSSASGDDCDIQAIENLKSALAISPSYADLHFSLGCAYQRHEQFEVALAAFDRALTINPGYVHAHLQRAVSLFELSRLDEAVQAVETAVPFHSSAFPHLSPLVPEIRAALDAGDRERLGELLREVSRENPDNAMHHSKRALDYFRRGMLEDAIHECQQALRIAPGYADLRNQFGVTLYSARRDAEAAQQFTRALEINPRYVEARLNRGLALLRAGQRDEARQDFLTVLEYDSDNQAALEHLHAVDSGASPP